MLAVIFGLLFFLLVASLHFLRPNLTPSSHMISQYAVGQYGWVMRLAFGCFAAACLALALALRPFLGNSHGSTLLIIIAVSMVGVGLFNTDPLEPVRDKRSLASSLHNLFSVIVVTLCPLAATVLYFELINNSQLDVYQHLFALLSVLTWVGFVGYVGGMAYFQLIKEKISTNSPLGYPSRFMITTYAFWVTLVAWVVSSSH